MHSLTDLEGKPIQTDPDEEVALVELLDRVLNKGVVVYGDITLSVAGIDLIYVGLHVLLTSVERMRTLGGESPMCRDWEHHRWSPTEEP
ncbi:MAG: gas vesicle protein [Myxococcota bacterium]